MLLIMRCIIYLKWGNKCYFCAPAWYGLYLKATVNMIHTLTYIKEAVAFIVNRWAGKSCSVIFYSDLEFTVIFYHLYFGKISIRMFYCINQ